MNDKKESTESFLSTQMQHQKRAEFHTHTYAKMSSIFFGFAFVFAFVHMLEADSNSAARVCSFSQQISSGEKVGDGWKEAWFF